MEDMVRVVDKKKNSSDRTAFKIGKVTFNNEISIKDTKILHKYQKKINSLGFIVYLRCGKIYKSGKVCKGRLKYSKKLNMAKCSKCNAKWRSKNDEAK